MILSEFFGLTVPKNFAREILVLQKCSGLDKKLWKRGRLSRFSVENFLSDGAEKNCSLTLM